MTLDGRWLIGLTEALASLPRPDDVIALVTERLGGALAASTAVGLRQDDRALRVVASVGAGAPPIGSQLGDAALAELVGQGTIERFKGARIVVDGERTRMVVELEASPGRRTGVVVVVAQAVPAGTLERLVLVARIAELALRGESPATRPAAGDRTAEHWEAIGRLTSTVLHELGNPVAFAALAASHIGQLTRAAARDPNAAEQAKSLADDLVVSVRQMAELLAELRRVSRGPEGARFVEPRAIVEGASRLAHAELRGVASITADVGELPLLSGSAGSLGAGLAHLFATVLHGQGGALNVTGHAEGRTVVLGVAGFDFRMPRAAEAIRIVRGLASSADGDAEVTKDGALVIRLPSASEIPPPSSRRAAHRPRLLVVDDEVALARALASALASSFDVEIAASAEEALARLEQATFDVVLCDVHLRGESGLLLHDRVAARFPALARRFALTSGGADVLTEERARARGLPILGKPFDWGELERELLRLATLDDA